MIFYTFSTDIYIIRKIYLLKALSQHIRHLSPLQFEELNIMCYQSRKLYNCSLYIVNEYYKATNKYLGYNALYHEIKSNPHYKRLPSKVAQQIVRLVDKDFRSFFALIRRKKAAQYAASVNPPKYKKKDSKFILVFPTDQVWLKNGKLKLTKSLHLPFSYKIEGKICQIVISPILNKYFQITIQYDETKKEVTASNPKNILGIDLGLNNLAACLSTVGTSLIVNGKPLKSYNQFWNKSKAHIQSELKINNNKYWSKRLTILSTNRDNFVNNYMNQSVALIIKHCKDHNIGNIVCGYNLGWKQDINLGKVNNQKFVNIPHERFKSKLEFKAKENGILFNLHEESYTSKCSFLDNESVNQHETYLGKRLKRGLFKTSKNVFCNADVQAAGNIIRKVFPKAVFADGIEGCIVSPVVVNPLK